MRLIDSAGHVRPVFSGRVRFFRGSPVPLDPAPPAAADALYASLGEAQGPAGPPPAGDGSGGGVPGPKVR